MREGGEELKIGPRYRTESNERALVITDFALEMCETGVKEMLQKSIIKCFTFA